MYKGLYVTSAPTEGCKAKANDHDPSLSSAASLSFVNGHCKKQLPR
jgi:hypothetical protein